MAKQKVEQPSSIPKNESPVQSNQRNIPNALVFGIFFLLIAFMYGRTLNYGFVLDDDLFIKNNPMMQEGLSAIPDAFTHGSQEHFKGSNFQMYRPVVVSSFLWQYQLFELDPKGYHAINILLYFLIACVGFKLLQRLLPALHNIWSAVIMLLFIAHPIHTEVVSNIKSQDELLAAFFSLTSLWLYLKAEVSEGMKWKMASFISFFLALFCKESVVAFVGIFFLTFWLLQKETLLNAVKKSIPFVALALVYILSRYAVLKNVPQGFETSAMENVLYAAQGFGEHSATRLGILLKYLQLMVFPLNLSWDYSYSQIPVSSWTSLQPIISLVLILLLLFVVFYFWKRKPAISYGLSFFAILLAPVANVFFLNGTTLAERFLFLPSFGFLLALVFLFLWILKTDEGKWHNMLLAGSLVIVLVASLLSVQQIKTWSDNFTLFEAAANHAPNSTRVNAGYATELMNKAQESALPAVRDSLVERAIFYLNKSLNLFPNNYQAAFKLGIIHSMRNENDLAKKHYLQSIKSHPDNVMALNNLGSLYSRANQNDSAIYCFLESFKLQENNELTLKNLMITHNNKADYAAVRRFGALFKQYGYSDQVAENILLQAQGKP